MVGSVGSVGPVGPVGPVYDVFAERGRHPGEHGTGTGHRHLLADDGPHGYLEAVAVAWSAQARPLGHERREKFVGAECCGDCHRVRVEVEKSTAALDRGAEVAQIAQAQRAGHVVGERTQCDESRNGRRSERAPVTRGACSPPVRRCARSAVGVSANTSRIVSLNWRMLAHPAATHRAGTESCTP